jgi:hypothetical protein
MSKPARCLEQQQGCESSASERSTTSARCSKPVLDDDVEDGEIIEDGEIAEEPRQGTDKQEETSNPSTASRLFPTHPEMWEIKKLHSVKARSKFAPAQIIIGTDIQAAYDRNCSGAVPSDKGLVCYKLAPMTILTVVKDEAGVPFKVECLRHTTFKQQGPANLSKYDQSHLFLRTGDQSFHRGYTNQKPVSYKTHQGTLGDDSYVDGRNLVVVRLIESIHCIGHMELEDWARLYRYYIHENHQSAQHVFDNSPGLKEAADRSLGFGPNRDQPASSAQRGRTRNNDSSSYQDQGRIKQRDSNNASTSRRSRSPGRECNDHDNTRHRYRARSPLHEQRHSAKSSRTHHATGDNPRSNASDRDIESWATEDTQISADGRFGQMQDSQGDAGESGHGDGDIDSRLYDVD